MDDDVRWSLRRTDVVRTVGFLVATVIFTVAALALLSLEKTSGRAFLLIFTTVCLAGGAVFGLVLSVLELVGDVRVERNDDERRVPSLR